MFGGVSTAAMKGGGYYCCVVIRATQLNAAESGCHQRRGREAAVVVVSITSFAAAITGIGESSISFHHGGSAFAQRRIVPRV